ncbi:ferritin-like fold-containing protein [Paeniglutamicibacter cryotolerans]|uniref:Ferritin-like domain-containing protein n=1 Tax=Paeniglutamicibacter cryotolerans TaxID=670079 RepID=A0A839QL44_9MICC|nr:ferritin-like fold-containing protein [Paeniglutamicibacter cryotolerans]MBB2996530.1 hypothetical protein [Paeniglutamicibacter cryotolerans]
MRQAPASKKPQDRYETALLGLVAYRELSAFERLSSDARFSPTLVDRESLARLAVAEFGHYELVREHIAAKGLDIQETMEPFIESIDALHERTKPGDWYESLIKAYVIDEVSADFYRAISQQLGDEARTLVASVQTSEQQTGWLRERLRLSLCDDPRLASRLALWGRRLLGEALTQARSIGEQYDYWGAADAVAHNDSTQPMTALFAHLVENHSRRMSALGLTA